MGPKRSLFNKPSWAGDGSKPQVDASTGIFSRNVVYEDIIESERKKRERKEASSKTVASNVPNDDSSTKRRRISLDSDDEAKQETKSESSDTERDSTTKSVVSSPSTRILRSTPTKVPSRVSPFSPSRTTPSHNSNRNVTRISIDSSDDSDNTQVKVRDSAPKPQTASASKATSSKTRVSQLSDEDEDEDDEYLRDLKRKAREKARRQKLGLIDENAEALQRSVTPIQDDKTSNSSSNNAAFLTSAQSPQFNDLADQTSAKDDPEVKILITPLIPGTKPLIITRRASQELRPAIEFWCQRQGYDKSGTAKVFFTWRGKRLYNTTTMNGILKQLRREEMRKGGGDRDPSEGKIHVEAVTEEIFAAHQVEKERKQELAEKGLLLSEDNSDGSAAAPTAQDEPSASKSTEQPGVVIRLSCQGVEPLILRVRPNTTISKIMAGFKRTRNVDAEKSCWLVFDGERLEPESLVADVGFEDEDTVEVYIR